MFVHVGNAFPDIWIIVIGTHDIVNQEYSGNCSK